MPLVNLLVLSNLFEYCHKSYTAKTRFLGYILFQTIWYNVNQFDVIGPISAKFCEITQNNSHYGVQGHSISLIFVSIEIPYATSYLSIIRTYILFPTLSKLLQIIGQILTVDRYLYLTYLFRVNE